MKTFFMNNPKLSYFCYPTVRANPAVICFGYHNFWFNKSLPCYRSQSFYTVHLVVSGKGYLEYNNQQFVLKANDVFVLPPNEKFKYYPDQDDPWEYIFYEFDGDCVESYLQTCGFSNEQPVSVSLNAPDLLPLFKSLFNDAAITPLDYLMVKAQGLLDLLLDSCINLPQKKKQTELQAQNVLQIIQLHHKDPDFTIQKLLRSICISHALLCKIVKDATGKSPLTYLNDLRMETVERLLLNSNDTVQEIAYRSGFSNYYYFLSQFKKRHGITTTEFKQLHSHK